MFDKRPLVGVGIFEGWKLLSGTPFPHQIVFARDVTIYKDSFIKRHYSPLALYDKLHQLVLEPESN
jgi:hypothetical protein